MSRIILFCVKTLRHRRSLFKIFLYWIEFFYSKLHSGAAINNHLPILFSCGVKDPKREIDGLTINIQVLCKFYVHVILSKRCLRVKMFFSCDNQLTHAKVDYSKYHRVLQFTASLDASRSITRARKTRIPGKPKLLRLDSSRTMYRDGLLHNLARCKSGSAFCAIGEDWRGAKLPVIHNAPS